ncbi:DUF262 domain-containing protein [Azotobacter chroococcum]|uniref:DUF262 domain-containing protein n=1 Tax=Azotobacter chroococcum TaxID=353 RepID=UPI00103E8EAB|nr:DUF262 domain-containing protein [Azotobacter chroococcum]TBW33670.1 DUF262 domain-containing protein [Azotobacter chroococcum]
MSTKTIEQFFTGKTLSIPAYQRDYAWTTTNVDDLFEDIEEAMDLGGGHYLGTFILSQPDRHSPMHVVDGQQRLTTLTMLLNALIEKVTDKDVRSFYRSTYISHPVHGSKFTVLGENQIFFENLLKGNPPAPVSDGQERLRAAYDWIQQRISATAEAGGQDALKKWLTSISNLEVLEFTESDEGKAIRMFQSVNDRGVPLAKMDIAKSLLIYYSNRFLSGELDTMIAERFGEAFRCFSQIKRLAAQSGYQIRIINRDPFREDDVFRYHYFAFDGEPYDAPCGVDYNATSETVLEEFLKPSLKGMRSDRERLRKFIEAYVSDLASFFKGLLGLVTTTRQDRQLYMLFVIQDVSATLYPLLIRLHLQKRLNNRVENHLNRSLLQLIEMVDLRVYKIQATNPQADIAALIKGLNSLDDESVANTLLFVCQRFMPSAKLQARLSDEAMYRNPGTLRIFLAYEDTTRQSQGAALLSTDELVALVKDGITIEHVIPQEPSFGIKQYGFHSEESYLENIHLLGNLLPLEKRINSACSNNSTEDKISSRKLYRTSAFHSVKTLAAKHANTSPAFNKRAIHERSASLAAFAVSTWPMSEAELTE